MFQKNKERIEYMSSKIGNTVKKCHRLQYFILNMQIKIETTVPRPILLYKIAKRDYRLFNRPAEYLSSL